jgi:hypothetical protein
MQGITTEQVKTHWQILQCSVHNIGQIQTEQSVVFLM